jgi:ArsR family transcriptional regulator
MHYRIVTPPDAGAARVLRQTLDWLKEDRGMQADRARLEKACASPARFVTLQSAPTPVAIKHSMAMQEISQSEI